MYERTESNAGALGLQRKTGEVGVLDRSDTQAYGMLLAIARIDEFDFAEHKENAHLIAAAPELYKALEDLADATYGFYPFDEGGHPCVVAAMAALDKARGETP